MKGLRKILRVSWTAKKTNEWVLNKAGVNRELLDTVKARNLAYYGHSMRKQGSCLEKEIMQGTVQAGEEDHARPGWTTSRHGQDSVGYAFIAQSQISVAFHSVMIANLTAYRGGYISVLDMFIALKFIGQCCTCGKKTLGILRYIFVMACLCFSAP